MNSVILISFHFPYLCEFRNCEHRGVRRSSSNINTVSHESSSLSLASAVLQYLRAKSPFLSLEFGSSPDVAPFPRYQ